MVRYGDVLSFDLTYNLVRNRHPTGEKWKVGVFLGMSSVKRMVPLGVVFTLFERKKVYQQMFKTLFKVMGRSPEIIMTDE